MFKLGERRAPKPGHSARPGTVPGAPRFLIWISQFFGNRRASMAACGHFLYRHASAHPVFTAFVVLGIFVNIHPFADEIGRVARVLYNFCLRTGGLRHTAYVPFYELAERSRGGYEISLRKAEIRQDWAALFDWCLAAHQLCDHISSRGAEQG